MHSFAATNMQRVIRKDPKLLVTKANNPKARNIAKALNFSLSYGGSSHSLKDVLICSEEEAETFIQAYFDGFPGLQQNFKKTQELAVKRGWIELDNFTGQIYFFPNKEEMELLQKEAWSKYPENYKNLSKEEKEIKKIEINRDNPELKAIWSRYFYFKGKLERKALNYRIQGNAATMSKIAGCLLYNKCGSNEKILNFIHDEIIVKINKNNILFADVVKSSMIEAGKLTCKKVKIDAEVEVASYWKH